MVDLEILKARGIDYEGLKKKLLHDDRTHDIPEKIKKWRELIRSRLDGARDHNVTTYKVFKAIDTAWDTPLQQVNPTLLSSLLDKPCDASVEESLRSWGFDLSKILIDEKDSKTGNMCKRVNVPLFNKISVPLVRCYVTARTAKIVNDRRYTPQFKYEPTVSNERSRARCEVITARIAEMCQSMGYFDREKQNIFAMMVYGEVIMFPMEEWYTEHQEVSADYPQPGEKIKDKNGDVIGKKVVVKEGIRYHTPHPTRTFWDRAHLQHTINSDTGVSYGGYWRVMRWGELRQNKSFYNLDSVAHGKGAEFASANGAFFNNVYQGCVLKFPNAVVDEAGVSQYDSEAHIANNYYSNADDDKGVLVTEYFEKLIPSDRGLGDYDYPVWVRTVVAGDDTIIYCAPLGYSPMIDYGYDVLEGRTLSASMALEVLPFQDQFTNLLTQLTISVKQNLSNLSFVNTDILDEEDIKKFEGGEGIFRYINIVRASFKKMFQIGKNNPDAAVISHKLPLQDTNGQIATMRVIIDTLERVLGMSPQEVGQAASHEQTREEVRNIAQNTSARVTFTSIGVDQARDAWKKQLYDATMAYGQEDFWTQIPMDGIIDEKRLKKLGFTYATTDPNESWDPTSRKAKIKANKTAILYESFVSDRDGDDRINNLESAKAMNEWLANLLGNPLTAQAIGPEQAIQAANYIGRMAGFPRDFKLHALDTAAAENEQQQEMLKQVQQYVEQVKQQIEGDVQGALGQVIDENKQQSQQIQTIGQQLAQMMQLIQNPAMAMQAQPQLPPAQPPQMMMPPPGMMAPAMPPPGQPIY